MTEKSNAVVETWSQGIGANGAAAALELIKTRRSTRKFTDEPIAKEALDAIIEAGRFAPSAKNNQTSHLIVIHDAKTIDTITHIVEKTLALLDEKEAQRLEVAGPAKIAKGSKPYVFHYGAKVLIIVCNKINYGNAMADSACVMENMMLMANALDLGSCWINQIRWLRDQPLVRDALLKLGMDEDESVYASLALGHPATKDGLPFRAIAPRSDNFVTYVNS